MARIVFAPLVSSVKGSIGGVTFQGNPSGQIIRLRPFISRSSTVKQTLAHTKLTSLLSQWQTVSGANKDLWQTFADTWEKTNKFGQSKTLTALNWFVSVNWWRTQLGVAVLEAPPAHTLPEAVSAFEIQISTPSLIIAFEDAHDYAKSPVAVWSTPPTRKNTLSINQVRRLVTVIDSDPGASYDLTAEWENEFGMSWAPDTLFPNSNIFVCCESIRLSTGITSAYLCAKSNITEANYYYY